MQHYDVVTHEHTYTVSSDSLSELLIDLQVDQVHILDVRKVDDHARASLADHSGFIVEHDNADWAESAMLGE